MAIIEIILIVFVGILGVLGGGALEDVEDSKFAARLLAGICFSYVLSDIHYYYWLYALWFVAASASGLGQPEGQAIIRHYHGTAVARAQYKPGGEHGDLEWWQWEWLRYRPYWSLAIRATFFLNPASIIANGMAMWLALRTPRIKDVMWASRWHEAYFPMITLSLTIGAVMAIN